MSLFDPELAPVTGATVLAEVEEFLSRFVAYPSEAARVAHVLWVAHAHLMNRWESTPRIAFLSPEPGSGKSRALEATGPLVPNACHAVNVSPAYLFRKMADDELPPTILFDEVDTVFGVRSTERTEEIRGLLNAGHRRGATAGRCEMRGKTVVTVDYPAYAAVALAGLNDLPDTVASRAVIVRMRRRGPGETVEPWRARIHEAQGHAIREDLALWAATFPDDYPLDSDFPDMPDGIADRAADVWESLVMVADAAGGEWPERARVAAVALVAAARSNERETLGTTLLRDLQSIFGDADAMDTDSILEQLNELESSPWGDLYGKPLDATQLAKRLRKFTDAEGNPIRPKNVRFSDGVRKGYTRASLADAWSRYVLPPSTREAVTPVTPVTTGTGDGGPVTPVTAVTAAGVKAGSESCRIHGTDYKPEACYQCETLTDAGKGVNP